MNKKVKKRIKCTKKKLATAAIAMIASGSLVPTSVSLAESSNVINQGSVSTVDNLLQLKSGQRSSQANSQVQLIGSFEELKQALANPYIKEVILTQDIYMTQTLTTTDIKNQDLLINGSYNGVKHTIDFSNYKLLLPSAAYSVHFKDINLRNGTNDGFPIIDYREGNVTLENVTHVGAELADGANLRFLGNVDVTIDRSIGGITNAFTSGYFHAGGGNFIVSENAKLTIKTAVPTNQAAMHATIAGANGGNFILEKNSSMVINQTSNAVLGVFDGFAGNVNFNIAPGATLDINSSNGQPGISAPFTLLNVSPGATLNVKTVGNNAIWCTGANGVINLSGARFNIETMKSSNAVSIGEALRMAPTGTINLKNQNVKAWLKNQAVRTDPNFEWDNITGYIKMQAYNVTDVFTNPINNEFNTILKNQRFSRLASDGEANKEIVQTTINEVKNTDLQVTGKAEPNAKIELKNGNVVIATGTVGSDGSYSLTIPKQSVGTVIKAVVTMDGLTSEATTTVTRGELSETTISDINTTTTSVSGKAEPNAKIELKNGNAVIATGTVGSDGFYSLTIPKQSVGTVIKAVVTMDGLTSEATTTVTRGELSETTISDINTTTTSVSGKAEPNAKVELKNGDAVIATGTVGSDGKYSLTIDKQPAGSTVVAVVTLDGKTSQASTVVTRAELSETTISDIDTTTTSVSGKAEPNAKIELKNGNAVIATGTVGSDGFYSLTIPKQSVGTVIKAVVTMDGLTSEATTTVTRGELSETTISDINTTTTSVSGKAEPNAKIELKNGNTVIATGTVGSDGKYSLTIDKQPAGSTIVAVVTLDGKTSQASTVVTRAELSETTISDINTTTTSVSGKAEPNAKIELKNGDTVIATGTVGSDGKYSLTIDKQPEGSTIVAVVTLDGKTSQASTVVKAGQTTGTVTAKEYQLGSGDGRVHGSFTGDVEWLRLEVNGQLYAWSSVTKSPYQYYAADKIKKASDKVYIVAYDKNKKELDRKQVLIKEVVKGTVTPNNYQIGTDNYLRGTYTGDVDSLKLLVNGKLYAKSTVSGNPFKYYVADKIKKVTDQVYIIAYDKNGKELDRKQVTVKEPQVNINLKVDSYSVGGVNRYVEGSFSGTGLDQVSYIRLEVNDILYQRTDKFVNNTFTYYAADKIKAITDEVYIVAYNTEGKELARQRVGLQNGVTKGTVKPATFVLGGSDNYVRGTYTGDVDSLKLEVNGKLFVKSTVKGSPFQYYAVDKIKNIKDEIYLVAYDVHGRQLDRQKVTIEEAVKTKITNVDTYVLGQSSYTTGTYEGAAKQVGITVNGVSYSPVNINNVGQLRYWSKNIITSESDKVKIAIYLADGTKADERDVQVRKQAGTISSVDSFKVGTDSRVTGTVDGAVAKVELEVNGVATSRISISGGKFSYYAKNLIKASTDKVKVIAYDATNNKLDEKEVPLIAATGTLVLDSPTFSLRSGSKITGTVKGDITKVKLVLNGKEQKTVNVSNQTFSYYAKELVTNGELNSLDDLVEVVGMDNTLRELARQKVTVID